MHARSPLLLAPSALGALILAKPVISEKAFRTLFFDRDSPILHLP